ncbi:MAG: hypothetical protein SVZ03_16100 [Spirochaetota bacterium]|nr:hypothetical protein [Spirochaetota bacterium]
MREVFQCILRSVCKNNRFFKALSLLLVFVVFTIHTTIPNIIPTAFSLTLEEQAGKKRKEEPPKFFDEFNEKTPERRDYQRIPMEKDPRLACLLSLVIPGGGHIYMKKDIKGIGIFMSTLVGYSFAGYYLYVATDSDASSSDKKSKLIISGLLFVLAVIVHIVGIVEAYNDAIEINEEKYYFGVEKSQSPYIAEIMIE